MHRLHRINDELQEFYLEVLSKYTDKVEASNESLMKYALRMYIDLTNKKRELISKLYLHTHQICLILWIELMQIGKS